METNERTISWVKDGYVLLDRQRRRYRRLRIGHVFEVWTGECWQRVTFQSGGYRGRYIETADGSRARLALCMRARFVG